LEQANIELLEAGLKAFGITPRPESVRAVVRHLELVAEWNERVNLTAITVEREMVLKHAIDSAAAFLVSKLVPGARVLDVGPGAGFPGVTLKCLEPGIDLVSVESVQKRCKFLDLLGTEVVSPLVGDVKGYEVVWARAEDAGQDGRLREQFDTVVARAVAELRVLSELCLPFCRVGGEFLAMKGPAASSEIGLAGSAISKLGGQIEEVRAIELPEEAGGRTLIRIRKVNSTPKTYPRKAGTPSKQPL
jgi:16S rRNA (guanine527-N7)-methyltransferase